MRKQYLIVKRPKRIHLFRTAKEAYYFGSDLNKLWHYLCTRKMDIMNIDCVTYRAGESADGMYAMRLIESKHLSERLSKRQVVLYGMIANNYRNNGPKGRGKKFPVNFYIVYANFPKFTYARIVDYRTKKSIVIHDVNIFILWSQFELSFEDIYRETKRYKKVKKVIELSQQRAKGSDKVVSLSWREWTKALKAA